jgi:hypothetical protein
VERRRTGIGSLYSYNHPAWYVKKVLAAAEGYRRLAKDNKVGPYIFGASQHAPFDRFKHAALRAARQHA